MIQGPSLELEAISNHINLGEGVGKDCWEVVFVRMFFSCEKQNTLSQTGLNTTTTKSREIISHNLLLISEVNLLSPHKKT